jgi:hypothetical protein
MPIGPSALLVPVLLMSPAFPACHLTMSSLESTIDWKVNKTRPVVTVTVKARDSQDNMNLQTGPPYAPKVLSRPGHPVLMAFRPGLLSEIRSVSCY